LKSEKVQKVLQLPEIRRVKLTNACWASVVNMTLPAFAAEHQQWLRGALAVGASCSNQSISPAARQALSS